MQSIQEYHFTTIGSTNTWAKDNVHLFSQERLVVITADEQTTGRGRFSRVWISPAGKNLYLTLCFLTDLEPSLVGNIPQVLAVSAALVLESLSFQPQLKWPNDILLSQKKLGGILCETVRDEKGLWVILGIGININMDSSQLAEIDRPATSLLNESGKLHSITEVKKDLVQRFQHTLPTFNREGFSPFYEDFKRRFNLRKGEPISVQAGNLRLKGSFEALQPDGSLVIKLEDGRLQSVNSGEIV